MRERPDRPGLPRRGVLRALALAPVALAGCAAGRAGPAGAAAPPPSTGAAPPPAPPARSPAPAALAAVRAFHLPADAEPAFVFRASVRPGEGK